MRHGQAAIIVHGGAGCVEAEREQKCREGCRAAASAGWEILAQDGSALDAVEAAVTALEDDPEFNAGTGSVLNSEGRVQLDASIMDSSNLAAGAVGNVSDVRNPIQLARRVLHHGRHVLMVGAGAEAFARQCGIPPYPNESLIVERQLSRWQERRGTVGAVALDSHGRLAAATSTGGRRGALPGRVGDSAQIGCGSYANEHGAVSCTGIGEDIIRTALAYMTVDLMESGVDALAAAGAAIDAFDQRLSSEAGLISISHRGEIGHARNTEHMPIAAINADGEDWTAI